MPGKIEICKDCNCPLFLTKHENPYVQSYKQTNLHRIISALGSLKFPSISKQFFSLTLEHNPQANRV